MIRTLVIDDEPIIRTGIINLLSELDENLTVVGNCGTVQEALVLANNCQPDLVLLDINLTDGTGFDFLNKVEKRNFNIIFITAHEEYALHAIKQGALDYILKPIDEDELAAVIKKAISTHESQLSERINIVNSQLQGKSNKIVLRLFDSFQIVRFDELIYCQSDGGYTTFHLTDKRKFTVSKSIKEYERLLPQERFIRTHQSFIVNLEFVDRYEKGGALFLKEEISVPVAIRKRDTLLSRLL